MKIFVLFIFSVLSLAKAQSKLNVIEPSKRPLWELGLFAMSAYLPDYPGAEQSHARYIGAPFFIYRGKIFRLNDQGGAAARIVHRPRWKLNISAAGSFPAKSSKNRARAGMPDLDWLGEFGPKVTYSFFPDRKNLRLNINIPIRSVWSSDIKSVTFRGFIFAPSIYLYFKSPYGKDFHNSVYLDMKMGDEHINDYFYQVTGNYANRDRPIYDAKAGLITNDLLIGQHLTFFKGRFKAFAVGLFSFHHLAKNLDSPLFKRKFNSAVLVGFSWRAYQSDKKGFK